MIDNSSSKYLTDCTVPYIEEVLIDVLTLEVVGMFPSLLK